MRMPNGPIARMALRYERKYREQKTEVQRLRGELAALHEVADTWQARFQEERAARVDLETLHGWMEAT